MHKLTQRASLLAIALAAGTAYAQPGRDQLLPTFNAGLVWLKVRVDGRAIHINLFNNNPTYVVTAGSVMCSFTSGSLGLPHGSPLPEVEVVELKRTLLPGETGEVYLEAPHGTSRLRECSLVELRGREPRFYEHILPSWRR